MKQIDHCLFGVFVGDAEVADEYVGVIL